jgi:mannose-6-phosphate isomerase-like protein (cupin superfamily)
MTDDTWQTKDLSEAYDYLAPDWSEIRLPLAFAAGGLAHCTMPPGGVSLPVKHKWVEEIWFFLEGQGEVWRREGRDEKLVQVYAGRSLAIASGVDFQFRNTGSGPLRLLIATLPKWPGPEEAVPLANGAWSKD